MAKVHKEEEELMRIFADTTVVTDKRLKVVILKLVRVKQLRYNQSCSTMINKMLAMSLPTKRCGRPPVLSFLEKKKRKQSLDRRRGKTRIYVGSHIDRWLTLKEKLDFRNDAEVAGFLLDLYDSYDPLLKASICSLPGGVRRKCVRDEKALSDSTSLIAADGTYDNDDQLSKESACSEPGDLRIVTVKEERDTPHDCLSTETDDTAVLNEATTPSVDC